MFIHSVCFGSVREAAEKKEASSEQRYSSYCLLLHVFSFLVFFPFFISIKTIWLLPEVVDGCMRKIMSQIYLQGHFPTDRSWPWSHHLFAEPVASKEQTNIEKGIFLDHGCGDKWACGYDQVISWCCSMFVLRSLKPYFSELSRANLARGLDGGCVQPCITPLLFAAKASISSSARRRISVNLFQWQSWLSLLWRSD